MGWNLIKDQDIIDIAKRNYLLVTLDPKAFGISYGHESPQIMQKIKSHKEDVFFVVANQALYPFREWTLGEKKESLIAKLEVGNGP